MRRVRRRTPDRSYASVAGGSGVRRRVVRRLGSVEPEAVVAVDARFARPDGFAPALAPASGFDRRPGAAEPVAGDRRDLEARCGASGAGAKSATRTSGLAADEGPGCGCGAGRRIAHAGMISVASTSTCCTITRGSSTGGPTGALSGSSQARVACDAARGGVSDRGWPRARSHPKARGMPSRYGRRRSSSVANNGPCGWYVRWWPAKVEPLRTLSSP
jgi:hypothetical protein